MAPGIDQTWIDGCRRDYDNPRKGHQGEGKEFCKCKQGIRRYSLPAQSYCQRTVPNPGSTRKKCTYQGMSGLRNEQTLQICAYFHTSFYKSGYLNLGFPKSRVGGRQFIWKVMPQSRESKTGKQEKPIIVHMIKVTAVSHRGSFLPGLLRSYGMLPKVSLSVSTTSHWQSIILCRHQPPTLLACSSCRFRGSPEQKGRETCTPHAGDWTLPAELNLTSCGNVHWSCG